jgi:hypothetical protein
MLYNTFKKCLPYKRIFLFVYFHGYINLSFYLVKKQMSYWKKTYRIYHNKHKNLSLKVKVKLAQHWHKLNNLEKCIHFWSLLFKKVFELPWASRLVTRLAQKSLQGVLGSIRLGPDALLKNYLGKTWNC